MLAAAAVAVKRSSHPAHGMEQLGRLRPHHHRRPVPRQRRRAQRQAAALRLELRGHRRRLVLLEPRRPPHPDKLRYAIDAYGRYVPVPARFPSAATASAPSPVASPITARPQTAGDHRGHQLQAALGRLGPCAGPEVRHPHRARHSAGFGRAQSAHRRQQPSTRRTPPTRPTPAPGIRPTGACSDNAAGQAWYDSLLRAVCRLGRRSAQGRLHRRPSLQARRDRHDSARSRRLAGRSCSVSRPAPPRWRMPQTWRAWPTCGASPTTTGMYGRSAPGKTFPQGVKDQFARLAAWAPYAKPGNWPDADMLPIGELSPHPGEGQPRVLASHP